MPAAPFVQALVTLLRNQPDEERLQTLQPICAHLEARQDAKAILACQKVLKKQRNFYAVHALKAYALLRSNKAREALDIFHSFDKDPYDAYSDPGYIRIMGYFLFALERHADIKQMYEIGTKKLPDNLMFAADAFLIFGELGDTKAQQQMALKMAKPGSIQAELGPLLYWALTSYIVALTSSSPSPTDPSPTPPPGLSLQLSLTHRILQTLLNTPRPVEGGGPPRPIGPKNLADGTFSDDPAECWAFARALQLIGSHTAPGKVLGVVDLNLVSAIPESERPSRAIGIREVAGSPIPEVAKLARQDLLAMLETEEGRSFRGRNLGLEMMWREVVRDWGSVDALKVLISTLETSLRQGDTNWHTMLVLVEAAFNLAAVDAKSEEDVVGRIDGVFKSLSEEHGSKERGYQLARIEIAARQKKELAKESIPALLNTYIHTFGVKTCCFDDVYRFLGALSADDRRQVVDALPTDFPDLPSGDIAKDLGPVARLINAEKIRRVLGPQHKPHEEVEEAKRLLGRYVLFRPLGKDLPSTDLQPADDFAILASQALVAAWEAERDMQYLNLAANVLGVVIEKSPYRFQAGTLLIRIFRLLGSRAGAIRVYRAMAPKQTQHDTMGHFALERISVFSGPPGSFGGQSVLELAQEPLDFYERTDKETRDWVSRAYHAGNYPKVQDFMELRSRLARSLSRRVQVLEALRTKLVAGTQLLGPGWTEQARLMAELAREEGVDSVDNRDWTIMPDFSRLSSPRLKDVVDWAPTPSPLWAKAIGSVYYTALICTDSATVQRIPEDDLASHLTPAELALYKLSAAFLPSSTTLEKDVGSFFEGRSSLLKAVEKGEKVVLPCELLETVTVSTEAYALIDIAVERASAGGGKDNAKSRLAARKAAKVHLREIGQLLRPAMERILVTPVDSGWLSLVGGDLLGEQTLEVFLQQTNESQWGAVKGLEELITERTKGPEKKKP